MIHTHAKLAPLDFINKKMKGERRIFYPNIPFLLKKTCKLAKRCSVSVSRMLKSVSVIQKFTNPSWRNGTFLMVNKVHNMICIVVLVIFLIVLCISQFQAPTPPPAQLPPRFCTNSQPGFAPSELSLIYNLFLLSRDKICFKARGE